MGLGLRIMGEIKRAVVPLSRHLETRNFTCGKVALGERLHFGFPRDWIRIDWAKADYCINLAEAPILPLKDNTTAKATMEFTNFLNPAYVERQFASRSGAPSHV
jgi:hypothetical protein